MEKPHEKEIARQDAAPKTVRVSLQDLLDAAQEGLDFRKILDERLKVLETRSEADGLARCK